MSLKAPNVVNPKKKKKRVAIVIANPAVSTTTQWPVGFWWSELTHLAKGKTVTGFANVEEDFADHAVWQMKALPEGKHLMPWRPR